MRDDLVCANVFPDYRLPDHTGTAPTQRTPGRCLTLARGQGPKGSSTEVPQG